MSDAGITSATLSADGTAMIRQPDGTLREAAGATDWGEVNARSAQQVDAAAQADPDALPLDDAFWLSAKIILPPRATKRHQGLRLDVEVLDWFKAQGPGWQTRMNAVLKSYVVAQRRGG